MAINYEEKKAARIERYKNRSERAEQKSTELSESASQMASVIPFGQPILVGHHSEGRDRNYRKRIGRTMDRAIEESKKADHWAERAESAEKNTSISSDDPEAIVKLKKKLEAAQRNQEYMKAVNAVIRKHKKKGNNAIEQALRDFGMTEKMAFELVYPKFTYIGMGYPKFTTSNNNANMRTMKLRLEKLEKQANDQTTEKQIGDILIRDNVEENRLQLIFPGKPSDEVRTTLKRNGFRWSRFNAAWQRQRGSNANYAAQNVINSLKGGNTTQLVN